jgi:phage gp46-like protein
MSHDDATDSAPLGLRARLELASREKLIEVIERLAADSAESAARINYLTDSSAAVKMLQRRISSIRSGKRFVSLVEGSSSPAA